MAETHETATRRPSRWWYLVFTVLVGGAVAALWSGGERRLDFSEFKRLVAQGRITGTVRVGEDLVRGDMLEGDETVAFETIPPPDAGVATLLESHGVEYTGAGGDELAKWLPWLLIPLALVLLFWLLALRGQGGATFSALHFGRHRARIHAESDTLVTFRDVAGVDEAVEEVQEIVEFLRAPERFQDIGGRVPKGVLLVGMPGTGKTLLARAVAGEAGVPFLSISGADFVEMFAGVGASRVRDLFARAKELAPCIVFIDELDAIGKARSATSGASEEREQTLNQMLVEMDGFESTRGVILLAATNRPEVLDQALLRPGRFDRQVVVDRPDVRGRLEILRLHTRNIKLGRNVDLAVIARRTPGFTGADLATLVNESALLAARRRRDQVGMALIEEAIDRVMAGLERRSRLISPREKIVVAVHETGHALAACLLERADPLHKVSVIPRGSGVGGMTLQLPREDRTLLTRDELLDRIGVLLGGRIAEDLIFKEISTGAANDLQRVTDIAYRMVVDYGMSETIGPVRLSDGRSPGYLPEQDSERPMSDETAREVDLEVRRIIRDQEDRVRALLEPCKRHLAAIARVLRDRETLDSAAFQKLLNTPLRRRQPSSDA